MLTKFEKNIYLKYAKKNLPRHTSYPAVPFWSDKYSETDFHLAIKQLEKSKEDLSLYFHIPYCKSLCYYCGCNKEIYNNRRLAASDPRDLYIKAIINEIKSYESLFKNPVQQIHLGGGTPTFLSPNHLDRMFKFINECFSINQEAEISVEIDPRVTSLDHLKTMYQNGVNRLSLGIQDFSKTVQKAINRVQSYEMVENMVHECRKIGYQSINFDLIYGLPFQSLESMEDTIKKTLLISPDRIAFYRLAMIPNMFSWQKNFKPEDLPSEEINVRIFENAKRYFTNNGYKFIGLDHFAKNNELLTKATSSKKLRRNFQGMTTGKNLAIIGFGPSAVSQTRDSFWQNIKKSTDWLKTAATPKSRIVKGISLSKDDLLRQNIIEELYCYGSIDLETYEKKWGIDSNKYFSSSLKRLKDLESEKILILNNKSFELTPNLGRLLVRLVAAQFDQYITQETSTDTSIRFSQLG